MKKVKNVSLAGLRNANKESKTISGAVKIIKAFWAAGYKDAFMPFGYTYKSIEVPELLKVLRKDEEGNCIITRKVAIKDEEGNFILKDGKRTYKEEDKVIKVWTPTTLYTALQQSK